MCGIVGVFEFATSTGEDEIIDDQTFIDMRDTMLHRGPDGQGHWFNEPNGVKLGHRRLTILDFGNEAAQPMCDDKDNIALVFNGEIYNYIEIRNELDQTFDIKWKTKNSDTEVILQAYMHWGERFVHKLRGMFSIAIFDTRSQHLHLFRDRIGIKPLYYYIDDQRIIFASEIKAILESKKVERKISEQALMEYLSFLTVPAPLTLFENILKLEPGCQLTVGRDGQQTITRYYDLLEKVATLREQVKTNSFDEIVEKTLHKLQESIGLHGRADVPVGVFLSGGIDSTTNATLFNKISQFRVKSFAIGYEGSHGSYKNELVEAAFAAGHAKTEHFETKITDQDAEKLIDHMVWLQDEPISDPVCVPLFYLSEFTRQNEIKVCQVGEGADELFIGYPFWKTYAFLQTLANIVVARPIQIVLKRFLNFFGKKNTWYYELLRRSVENQPVFWSGAQAFTENQINDLLNTSAIDITNLKPAGDKINQYRSEFLRHLPKKDILTWMGYADLRLRLPDLLLMRVDKMSMGNSLEARVPFLDHEFVEFALAIPPHHKLKNGNLKNVLKAAVRGIIPDEIIDRKKQGFGAPVADWNDAKFGATIEKEIRSFQLNTKIFNEEALDRILGNKGSSQIWYLYNLSVWWRTFLETDKK